LPWSTWPIVPTFTCGLVRSNFPFAIAILQKSIARVMVLGLHHITVPAARAQRGV
jgi:hypothetical protein